MKQMNALMPFGVAAAIALTACSGDVAPSMSARETARAQDEAEIQAYGERAQDVYFLLSNDEGNACTDHFKLTAQEKKDYAHMATVGRIMLKRGVMKPILAAASGIDPANIPPTWADVQLQAKC